jgi:hypothetical protein
MCASGVTAINTKRQTQEEAILGALAAELSNRVDAVQASLRRSIENAEATLAEIRALRENADGLARQGDPGESPGGAEHRAGGGGHP